MAVVEATSRGAMRETRQLPGVLREAGSPEHEAGSPERGPSPGLGDLETLAEGVRATGVRVEVEREGDLTAVPAAVELSAYRVAQEALTNMVKHVPGASAAVRVAADHGPQHHAKLSRVRGKPVEYVTFLCLRRVSRPSEHGCTCIGSCVCTVARERWSPCDVKRSRSWR
jgi:hypothetical protein